MTARATMVLKLLLKLGLTSLALWLCWNHPLQVDGQLVSVWQVVRGELGKLQGSVFWGWLLAAVLLKGIGILCAMLRWALLLYDGQLHYPWQRLVATFFIGRFIGTFTPGTIGLDAYKLYDGIASTNQSARFFAATFLEKLLGLGGLLGTCLLCAPFGYAILEQQPGWLLYSTLLVAGSLLAAVVGLALFPKIWWQVVQSLLAVGWSLSDRVAPKLVARLTMSSLYRRLQLLWQQLTAAVLRYQHARWTLLAALLLSIGVHGTTAVVYYCTAQAVGATGASIGEILFASSLQIVATILFPFTIAGEGIREAVQALLLGRQMGLAHSILSAALGFWAAESLSFLGAPLWLWRGFEGKGAGQAGLVEAASAAVASDDGSQLSGSSTPT